MDVEARIGQALDLERRGRLREAEQALREALALAPHDRDRRLHLARVLLHRGRDERTEGRSILRALVPGTPDAGGGPVRALLASVRGSAEIADVTDEAVRLQQAYLAARVVGARWETDALHVAIATVSACAAIVSWNFKHIVNFARIPLYNGINLSSGYEDAHTTTEHMSVSALGQLADIVLLMVRA